MTLNVTLNDLSLALPAGSTLADAIGAAAPQLQIAPPFAASVNGDFVPKAHGGGGHGHSHGGEECHGVRRI